MGGEQRDGDPSYPVPPPVTTWRPSALVRGRWFWLFCPLGCCKLIVVFISQYRSPDFDSPTQGDDHLPWHPVAACAARGGLPIYTSPDRCSLGVTLGAGGLFVDVAGAGL
jgi:hypothetical protein